MSFLDELDADEYADGHNDHTGHVVMVDKERPREDGKVQAYCLECEWIMWGKR